MISTLYICTIYEESSWSLWGKQVIVYEEKVRIEYLLIWGTDWNYFSTADHVIITLDPSSCCILEVLLVTEYLYAAQRVSELGKVNK